MTFNFPQLGFQYKNMNELGEYIYEPVGEGY